MTAGDTADLLVEIGTEELPPKALKSLMTAFGEGLAAALAAERLAHGTVETFASPRRLAVRIADLAGKQPDRAVEQKGPPVAVAFDADGQPTRAATAFADKCGVAVDALEREQTERGEWLVHRATEAGRPATELLPACVQAALASLPVPRRMRWGAGEAEFVRPVHWVVMLHGDAVVPGEVLGIASGRATRGHRFMAPGELELREAAEYPDRLANEGYVVADFALRRQRIVAAVAEAARKAGGSPVGDDDLYDEVTALTEWPVALTGRFDEQYLELPKEVIVATLAGHQRYFPVAGQDGRLEPSFVTVANLESEQPDKVRDGNERVIRPRLADAAFFYGTDRKRTLADRQDGLANVVYQQKLGTLADRSRRVATLAAQIAGAVGADAAQAERAALLAKCDLLTGVVGEFPELQGTMGYYYARADREPADVAAAIGEQYLPRFAGDALPASALGRVLAVADKLEMLCGIFAAGKKPSGNRDPFGLRRAALGIVRIVVESPLELELPSLIAAAMALQPLPAAPEAADEVYEFIVDRLRGVVLERAGYTAEMFEAVRSRRPASLADFASRLDAVARFVDDPAAESLAAANKRIANILRQAAFDDDAPPETGLFDSDAERALHASLGKARKSTRGMLEKRRYADVLAALAGLRETVDTFFDEVMVMAEDEAVRRNRLRLLAALRAEFLNVADISRLAIARG